MNNDIVDQSNNNSALTPLDGLDGYAHKMSEGHTFYDKYAKGRLGAAKVAGTRYICAYHVLRAGTTSGTDQANYYLDCCVDAGFDPSAKGSLTMNDWEGWSDGFATKTQAMDFADRVNYMTGRESVIHYGGLPNPYDMGDHIWLADYRPSAPALNRLFPKAAVWQWGNQAAGGGDTNQIIDAAWLDHLAGYDDKLEPDVLPAEVDMADLFRTNDAIHWPGSSTLPAGDYPAGAFIVFTLEAGAVRHVPASEFQVYAKKPTPTPIAIVTGMDIKGMLNDYGVYATPPNGGGGPSLTQIRDTTDAVVKARLEQAELRIDWSVP